MLRHYSPQALTRSQWTPPLIILEQSSFNKLMKGGYQLLMMTTTKSQYAQIEKEALAITWACEKFSSYVLGKQIILETDYKPLVPLLTYKHLDNLRYRSALARDFCRVTSVHQADLILYINGL